MNRKNFRDYWELLGAPVLLGVLGLILAACPDFASGLVAQLIGWLVIAAGAAILLSLLISGRAVSMGGCIRGAVLVLLGVTIVRHPNLLAKFLGLILAFVLSGAGLRKVRAALRRQEAGLGSTVEVLLSLVTLIAGIVLFFTPMTASRVIIRVCGFILMAVGLVRVLLRLHTLRFLDEGSDHSIIDADE